MPEYTHDPEFPFLVLVYANPVARFKNGDVAHAYAHRQTGLTSVVDTTPKPRIPVDAQYIMWSRHLGRSFAYRVLTDRWVHRSEVLTEEELFRDYIGDAEITVLDSRKEES